MVLAVGAGGFWYLQAKSARADDANTVAQQVATQQSVTNDKDYQNFLSTQKSLSDVSALFGSHLGWASLVPKFAAATLKTATFSSFQATSDGSVDVVGTVPSFADLDKMLQGFQLQDFSSYIKSVSLVNVGLSNGSGGNGVSFSLNVQVNPSILQYQNQ